MPPKNLVMVRTSERTCFKRCRQQWKWAYIDQLEAKLVRSPLGFGTLCHQALEIRYPPGRKRGPHPGPVAVKIYRQYLEDGGAPFTVKIGKEHYPPDELAEEMLTNYVDLYGTDDRYEVIASEQVFQVDIYSPTGNYLYTYVGTFDGIWRDLQTRKVGFVEHKTGSDLEPFGAPLALDEQAGSYWAYGPLWLREMGILPAEEELDFILYNRLRKAFKDTRATDGQGRSLNKDGTVSKVQPLPLFKREYTYRAEADRINLMERVALEVREMRLARAGKLGIYKNPDRHCGFCEFRDMCEVHETGSDWEAIRDNMFKQWKPYEAQEIQTERFG